MGHGPPWSDAELRDISTVTFGRADAALLTVHGAGDDNVYVAQGERITEALRSSRAEAEFIRIEGREGNAGASASARVLGGERWGARNDTAIYVAGFLIGQAIANLRAR